MAVALWEVSYIPRAVIERRGGAGRREQGRACLATNEERPFIAAWVPMNFTHATWVHCHQRGSRVGGDGEGEGVDDLDGSALHFVRGLLGEVVRVALGLGQDACRASYILLLDVLRCRSAGEDIKFIFGNVVESGNGEVEVFGEDLAL